MTINPEGSDFYRPMERRRRGGLPALVVKLSGGRLTDEGANKILLGFAVIVFVIAIIILVTTI